MFINLSNLRNIERDETKAAYEISSKNYYDDFLDLVQKYRVIFEDEKFKNYDWEEEGWSPEAKAKWQKRKAELKESAEAYKGLGAAINEIFNMTGASVQEQEIEEQEEDEDEDAYYIDMSEVCKDFKTQAQATNEICKLLEHIRDYIEDDEGNLAEKLYSDTKIIERKIGDFLWWRFSYDELEKSAAKVLEFFSTYEYIKNERKSL